MAETTIEVLDNEAPAVDPVEEATTALKRALSIIN